jgi:hypothetical protein
LKEKEMQPNAEALKKTKCLGITLIVFSIIGCGNIFTLLEAIFALVGSHQSQETWQKWKKAVRIMYIIGLIGTIFFLVCWIIVTICYVVIFIGYINSSWYYERELAASAMVTVVLFIFFSGFAIAQMVLCSKTYRAYSEIYNDGQGYAPAPAVGYPGPQPGGYAQPPPYGAPTGYAPPPTYPPQGVYPPPNYPPSNYPPPNYQQPPPAYH